MNSELYDKIYKLPEDVLNHIRRVLTHYPNGDGVRRAKFMLKNGEVTYQVLKRLKNFFDNFQESDERSQYELAGGDLMKDFVNNSLNRDRSGEDRSRDSRTDLNVDLTQGVKLDQNPSINENDEPSDDTTEQEVTKNALAVIINNDRQILLLKRSPNEEYWGAGKWALVGGAVEEGETPIAACQREIWEETGLQISKFNEKFTIQRNPDSIEHIFVAKYDGDQYDVKLNEEHVNYGWYSPEEVRYLDHVPNLMEYMKLAFEKYD